MQRTQNTASSSSASSHQAMLDPLKPDEQGGDILAPLSHGDGPDEMRAHKHPIGDVCNRWFHFAPVTAYMQCTESRQSFGGRSHPCNRDHVGMLFVGIGIWTSTQVSFGAFCSADSHASIRFGRMRVALRPVVWGSQESRLLRRRRPFSHGPFGHATLRRDGGE